MLADVPTARPHTTDFIPNPSDLTTQVTTKHERRLCATPLSTVGSVSKAHESATRGPLTTSYLATATAHFFQPTGRATLDAATQSKAGTQMEGGQNVDDPSDA
jgi:hypothetical protein